MATKGTGKGKSDAKKPSKGARIGAPPKKTPAKKHPGGRPRTKSPKTVSGAMLKQIDDLARAQAKDTMIAETLGFDVKTFQAQFSKRCRQKRAEGKARVMQAQYAGSLSKGKGAVTERIWWGKQHLEQTDKQEVAVDVRSLADIAAVMRGDSLGDGKA